MTDLTFQDPKSLVNRAAFNERFGKLNELYRYWWKKRTNVENTGYAENRKDIADVMAGLANTNHSLYFFGSGFSSSTTTVKYADSISFNEKGDIVFSNEKSITFSNGNTSGANVLKGKYVKGAVRLDQWELKVDVPLKDCVFYIPSTASLYIRNNEVSLSSYNERDKYYYVTSVYYDEPVVGEWEFVFSDDRSAYPDSGEQNGYEYQYLGIPFENAREASRATLTSYIGTGKYGESSPCSVSANFILSACMILSHVDLSNLIQENSSAANRIMYADELTTEYVKSRGLCGNVNYIPSDTSYGKKSEDGKTFYWYNEKGASEQLNEKGIKYYILLFG